jgi:hypothetical protein
MRNFLFNPAWILNENLNSAIARNHLKVKKTKVPFNLKATTLTVKEELQKSNSYYSLKHKIRFLNYQPQPNLGMVSLLQLY